MEPCWYMRFRRAAVPSAIGVAIIAMTSLLLPQVATAAPAASAVASPLEGTGWVLPASALVPRAVGAAPSTPTITAPADSALLTSTPIRVEGSGDPQTRTRVTAQPSGASFETVSDSSGYWQLDASLPNGTHRLTAVATAPNGDASPSSDERVITIDTVAPVAPVISTPPQMSSTNQTLVRFSGIAEPGATLRLDEGATLATLTVNGDSSWTTQFGFTQGSHTVTARVWDAAGHASPPTVRTFSVDLVAPSAPEILSPTEGEIIGADGSLIAGQAEPGADVFVNRGGIDIGIATAASDGTWFVRVGSPAGSNQIRARQRDRAGNVGPYSPPRNYLVDATPPIVEISTPNGQVFLPGQIPSIAGTATDDFGVLDVRVDFYDLIGRGVMSTRAACSLCPTATSINWSTSQTPMVGRFVVKVYANDRVGNRSLERSIVVTIARTP